MKQLLKYSLLCLGIAGLLTATATANPPASAEKPGQSAETKKSDKVTLKVSGMT